MNIKNTGPQYVAIKPNTTINVEAAANINDGSGYTVPDNNPPPDWYQSGSGGVKMEYFNNLPWHPSLVSPDAVNYNSTLAEFFGVRVL